MNCIDLERLTAYWLGELADEEEIESHVFACARCSERLEWLAALGEGIRAAVRAGAVGMVVSAPFVEAMRRAGLRLREYPVAPGGRVRCTIRAEDDAVVSRLAAPLAGAKRLDLLLSESEGLAGEERILDVPFDPAAGELLYLPSAARLRTLPAHTLRVRLVAVDEKGEAPLGEYTFMHTPS